MQQQLTPNELREIVLKAVNEKKPILDGQRLRYNITLDKRQAQILACALHLYDLMKEGKKFWCAD